MKGEASGTNECGFIHSPLSGQMRSMADLCKDVTLDKKWSNYSNRSLCPFDKLRIQMLVLKIWMEYVLIWEQMQLPWRQRQLGMIGRPSAHKRPGPCGFHWAWQYKCHIETRISPSTDTLAANYSPYQAENTLLVWKHIFSFLLLISVRDMIERHGHSFFFFFHRVSNSRFFFLLLKKKYMTQPPNMATGK